jgi:hypothetical protein
MCIWRKKHSINKAYIYLLNQQRNGWKNVDNTGIITHQEWHLIELYQSWGTTFRTAQGAQEDPVKNATTFLLVETGLQPKRREGYLFTRSYSSACYKNKPISAVKCIPLCNWKIVPFRDADSVCVESAIYVLLIQVRPCYCIIYTKLLRCEQNR